MIVGPKTRLAIAALFLAAIWLPLVALLIGPDRWVSEAEKRKLAPLPQFKLDVRSIQQYSQAFERFYNDHFGFRDALIRWYNIIQVRWLGVTDSKWVLVGADGWLFQGGDTNVREMRNAWPFGPGELAHWGTVLTRKQEWLNRRNIAYLFVITSNKHNIYPEYLPQSIKQVATQSRVDQLIEYLRAHTQVPVLDLRGALLAAKQRLRTHHKTDTHWNDYGAYVGYETVMSALAKRFPQLRTLELGPNDFTPRVGPGGDLAQALNMHDSLSEVILAPSRPVRVCARDITLDATADDRIRNQQAFATACDEANHRLLMFRDSYSLAMMPYLSESFRYVYYVPHSPVPLAGLQSLTLAHAPDIVIEQRSARWLRTPEG